LTPPSRNALIRSMRIPRRLPGLTLVVLLLLPAAHAAPNQLTPDERAAGWKLLFDGTSTAGWRGFKKSTFPEKGWVVADGCLKHVAKGGGGDLVSEATFGDFELSWEWRLAPDSNSGVKYFITEERSSAIGHEYQMVTKPNVEAADQPTKHVTASFYDVLPTETPIQIRPPDQFNESRVVVRGTKVEHWLNGARVLAYELGSPATKAAVASSKFRSVPGFGEKLRGRLLLQDHGGEVCFRNVKLRELQP
jgi:hypothetical protein